MTVAQLGIEIQSGQAASATVNLDALAAAAGRAQGSVDRLGVTAPKAFKPISSSTANIAAQFQDIAVQLQSGQSPFIIALQQGTQLSSALGEGKGLKGTLTSVLGGLTSLVSPVSLITIGSIAAGGALIQMFQSMAGGAEAAAERALERQKTLIEQITLASKGAGDALKSWLEIGHGATPNQLVVSTREQIKAARDELKALTSELDNMASNRGGGRSGPTNPLAFQPQLLGDITEAIRLFERGDITASALKDRLAELQLDPKLTDTTKALIRGFSDVADKIAVADTTARAFESTMEALRQAGGPIISGDFSQLKGEADLVDQLRQLAPDLRTEKQKAIDAYNQNSGLDVTGAGKAQLDFTLKQIAAQKAMQDAEQAARQAASAAKSHAEAVKSVTESLSDQLTALHQTNREQFISEQLSRAKADAASDEGQKIAALAGSLYDQKEAAKSLKDTLDDLDATGKSLTEGFFSTLKRDLQQGVGLWQSFGDAASGVLDSLADKALKMAADGIWNAIFGAISGGLTGGIGGGTWGQFGGFAGFKGSFGVPGFASGTDFAPGGMAIVGENGPELVNLPRGSQVIPNGQSMRMAANQNPRAAANGNDPVRVMVEVSVKDDGKLAVIARQEGGRAAQVVVQQTVPQMIASQAPAATATARRNRIIG